MPLRRRLLRPDRHGLRRPRHDKGTGHNTMLRCSRGATVTAYRLNARSFRGLRPVRAWCLPDSAAALRLRLTNDDGAPTTWSAFLGNHRAEPRHAVDDRGRDHSRLTTQAERRKRSLI